MQLYPYQKEGVDFLLKSTSGLIADEVGLGKTIQALSYIGKTSAYPVLILCPAILKWQWKEETERWLPGPRIAVIGGSASERLTLWQTPADIYIANYELLLRDLPEIARRVWEVMVCDEATRIANPWTKTYKTLYNIKARRRVALTGTPVSNTPQELWGILNWCYPGILGKYRHFVDRYCVRNMWGGIFGYQNMEELRGRVKNLMIRRLKKDVLPQLPKRISSDIPLELSEKEYELYKKIQKELLFEIEKEDIAKIENPITIQNTLTKMLRLRQVTGSLELLGNNDKSGKLEGLKELLPTILNGDRKTIIFTFFSSMADILERELKEYKPLKITGEVSGREEIIAAFNSRPEHRILCMTSAGQYGLNIQAASVIIHYDQEWSLAKMEQRTGRAWRIGQQRSVLEYNLIARKTIDEYIRKVLHRKQKVSDAILPVTMSDIRAMLSDGTQENLLAK